MKFSGDVSKSTEVIQFKCARKFSLNIFYFKNMSGVTAWIVAVAWIVAGDNSCRCSQHELSPAKYRLCYAHHRRQFMPHEKKISAYIDAVGIIDAIAAYIYF